MELQSRLDLQLLAKYASRTPRDSIFLEIGTHVGDSAIVLSDHAPWAHVYTIDNGTRWLWEKPHSNLKDYGDYLLAKFEGRPIFFILGDSHSKDHYGVGWVDLLFIDGDHDYEAVMLDLECWADRIKPEGYLVFHDYVPDDPLKVQGAVDDYLLSHPEWRVLELVDSMLVCQRKLDD